MKRNERAVELFLNGYRCSQAVLDVFAEDLGLDAENARKISIGLAGGAGTGGPCGAVSAAYLVNGLAHGFGEPGEPEKFWPIIHRNVEFDRRFKEINRATGCRELLGVDLMVEEGKAYFAENQMKEKVCAKLVESAVEIAEQLLIESGRLAG